MFVVDIHAPVFWSAIAEAVDYGHAETGKRVSGLPLVEYRLPRKPGWALRGLWSALLDAFGYVPDAVQSSTRY
jgi:GPH family glycoside/pentoside/hexuronide:cation symporter